MEAIGRMGWMSLLMVCCPRSTNVGLPEVGRASRRIRVLTPVIWTFSTVVLFVLLAYQYLRGWFSLFDAVRVCSPIHILHKDQLNPMHHSRSENEGRGLLANSKLEFARSFASSIPSPKTALRTQPSIGRLTKSSMSTLPSRALPISWSRSEKSRNIARTISKIDNCSEKMYAY